MKLAQVVLRFKSALPFRLLNHVQCQPKPSCCNCQYKHYAKKKKWISSRALFLLKHIFMLWYNKL